MAINLVVITADNLNACILPCEPKDSMLKGGLRKAILRNSMLTHSSFAVSDVSQ